MFKFFTEASFYYHRDMLLHEFDERRQKEKRKLTTHKI